MLPDTQKKPITRLRKVYYFSFGVTMIFITVMVYGFVLLMKDSLNRGERMPRTIEGMVPEEVIANEREARRRAEAAQQMPGPAANPQPPADQPAAGLPGRGTSEENLPTVADRRHKLSVDEIMDGAMRGEERALGNVYLLAGLILTFIFGTISTILYMMSSRDDYVLRPPAPRPRTDTSNWGRRI